MSAKLIELPANLRLIGGGKGDRRKRTACLMSAAAWMAGRRNTDQPPCVCPVIRAVAMNLNDMPWPCDAERTAVLLPLVPVLIGTRADIGTTRRRAFLAADYAARVFAGAAFDVAARQPCGDAARLAAHAAAIRELAAIDSVDAAQAARHVLREAAWVAVRAAAISGVPKTVVDVLEAAAQAAQVASRSVLEAALAADRASGPVKVDREAAGAAESAAMAASVIWARRSSSPDCADLVPWIRDAQIDLLKAMCAVKPAAA